MRVDGKKKKLRKFGRTIYSAMDPHSASPCFRVMAAGTGKTKSSTVTGAT